MKLTTLIILIAFMQVNAKTYSQITLHVNNKPLTEVLETVKKQTGYVFFYEGHLLDNINVSVDVNNVPLKAAIDKCLKDLPLTYKIVKKNVVITQKGSPLPEQKTKATLVPITISGKVTDSLGTPLIGATIAIKGSNKVTLTNDNGEFTLKAQANDILTVSYIGYKPFEVAITNSDLLNLKITFHPVSTGLKEVVVNTGFQTLPLERSAGSFVTVDNKLYNERVSPNVIDRLEGNVPGLIFNKPNQTSNAFDITIRGHSTLFSNDQPLIVVDNFPYDGDINNLNPNDIESVTILKDAAAASIWGVRSGNGVIVLTTKKGKRNQPLKVEFNANLTVGDKPNLYYGNQFVDANEYINIEQKLFNIGYYDGKIADSISVISPVVQLLANQRAGTMSPADVKSQIDALRTNDVRNDLSRFFYQKSITQQYGVNFSGGNANSNYYFSAGEDHDLSNQVGNSSNRITINSRYNFNPIKNLQINAEVDYTKTNQQNNSALPLQNYYPYTRLADNDGNPLPVPNGLSEVYKRSTISKGFLDWEYRPLQDLKRNNNISTGIDNLIKIGAKYDLISGLNIQVNYQYEKSEVTGKQNQNVDSYFARDIINKFTQINSDGSLSYPLPIGGILNTNIGEINSQKLRAQFDYSKILGGNKINLLAGSEIQHLVNESTSGVLYGYDANSGTTISTVDFNSFLPTNPYGSSAQIPNSAGIGKITSNFIRYFANGGYTFNDLYTLNISGSIDHSNLFGVSTNQKAVPVYSAGLAWNISHESFYNFAWLPNLRPRITYGYTANINLNAAAVTTISQFTSQPIFPSIFANVNVPGNPDLRWEKTRMINAGLDFGAKNNLITGSLEFYWKKGIDLFGSSPLPLITGLTSFFGNNASTQGKGFDITINSLNINHSRFKWTSNLVLSHVVDKVTKYDVTSTSLSYLTTGGIIPIVGAPVFSIYSYKWAGLNHDTGDPQGYVSGKPSTDYATILANNASIDSLQYNGTSRDALQKHTGASYLFGHSYGGLITLEAARNNKAFKRSQSTNQEYLLTVPSTQAGFLSIKNI